MDEICSRKPRLRDPPTDSVPWLPACRHHGTDCLCVKLERSSSIIWVLLVIKWSDGILNSAGPYTLQVCNTAQRSARVIGLRSLLSSCSYRLWRSTCMSGHPGDLSSTRASCRVRRMADGTAGDDLQVPGAQPAPPQTAWQKPGIGRGNETAVCRWCRRRVLPYGRLSLASHRFTLWRLAPFKTLRRAMFHL